MIHKTERHNRFDGYTDIVFSPSKYDPVLSMLTLTFDGRGTDTGIVYIPAELIESASVPTGVIDDDPIVDLALHIIRQQLPELDNYDLVDCGFVVHPYAAFHRINTATIALRCRVMISD